MDDQLEDYIPPPDMSKKTFKACPFQRPCWRDIRHPKIRAAAKEGIKIYLPYICSFQNEGDLENCSHHEKYVIQQQQEQGEVSVNGGSTGINE